MSVKVRPYRRGGWEVDISVRLADGTRYRERSKATVSSQSAALRWGEQRERHLLINGRPQPPREVPTLREFAPRFIDGHARANQQKPGGIAQKELVLRVHLIPHLGQKRLDAIGPEDVQRLKLALNGKAPKTVNNVLTVLSTMLKKAVEWDVIDRMPCTIRLIKCSPRSMDFYDSEEFERLLTAARTYDARAHLIVLLGGEAGLRAGEMRALEWTDINFAKQQLCIQRGDWRGQISATKGGRLRYVPMTARLAAALHAHRHLRSPRVLCRPDGRPLNENAVRHLVMQAASRGKLRCSGPHMLRHTFCSRLAMQGAPARAIQELAGHRDLSTTQRYMHLSPQVADQAIRLLEPSHTRRGDILETREVSGANV